MYTLATTVHVVRTPRTHTRALTERRADVEHQSEHTALRRQRTGCAANEWESDAVLAHIYMMPLARPIYHANVSSVDVPNTPNVRPECLDVAPGHGHHVHNKYTNNVHEEADHRQCPCVSKHISGGCGECA